MDQYVTRLTDIYEKRKQPLLPQLKEFFPQKQFIDHEFGVLKSLLDDVESKEYLAILLQYWKDQEIINHICRGCQIIFSQHHIPNSVKELSVLENILAIDDQTSGETCLEFYQNYRNYFMKDEDSARTLELIAQWSKCSKLLQFLYKLQPNGINDLLEIVNDWDESIVTTESVFGLILLKKFCEEVDTKSKVTTLEPNAIILCYKEVLKNDKYKEIISNFESCYQNLSNIERILAETGNKEQSKRKRILDIMKNSDFSFNFSRLEEKLTTDNKYFFDVNVTSNDWNPMSFDNLNELRDRARLVQHESSDKNNLQNMHTDNYDLELKSFISLVDAIEVILRTLTSLYEVGYPVVKQYQTTPINYHCRDNNYQDLETFQLGLKSKLEDWEKTICEMYEQCTNLTYFSHQQIATVYDALITNTIAIPNNSAYHLLKFIGIDPQSIDTKSLPGKSDDPLDMLRTVVSFVKTNLDSSQPVIEADERKSKKILMVKTSNKGILHAIYSLSHLENMLPDAKRLFYCTERTSWMQLRAFIYRCFYSQTFHQLIWPELLSIFVQDQFRELLYQLFEKYPKRHFCLGIITKVSTAHLSLVDSSTSHHIVRDVRDEEMLNETDLAKKIKECIGEHCTLVRSEMAGLGKSTYVENDAVRRGKRRMKFPISGDVDVDILTERLRDPKIQSTPSSIVIHIDIGPVQNIQQLNEFLYCLLLFRCFWLGQLPVCINPDIPIYIELDSSSYLSNRKDELTALHNVSPKDFTQVTWEELHSESEDVQLVVRYLKAIANGTINTKNIDENTKNVQDKATCSQLLKKHFIKNENTKFISWTQLRIFISIYHRLFFSFARCAYFYADPKNSSSLRFDILKNLLDSSDQFTSLSVEQVRENQRLIYESETSVPFSEAIIRWDKSRPFTLIFTFDNEPLFIYKQVDNVPNSLKLAFSCYYETMNNDNALQITRNSRFLSFFSRDRSLAGAERNKAPIIDPQYQLQQFFADPNSMTHEEFFLRLTLLSTKYSTHKPICSKCNYQYEHNIEQCTLCSEINTLVRPNAQNYQQHLESFQKHIAQELHSKYVFTADNYVKMLLIYLRIQSGLPVLIMGETGKTQALFHLYNIFISL